MYVSIAKISRLLDASAASEEAVDDADFCVEFSSVIIRENKKKINTAFINAKLPPPKFGSGRNKAGYRYRYFLYSWNGLLYSS